jgi:spore maturation protein SpmA
MMHNSADPMEIIGVVMAATLISTVFGLLIDRIWGRMRGNG